MIQMWRGFGIAAIISASEATPFAPSPASD
jgi:hypothetical protein